jgi:LDH2 family malate/lactate/ureidoglycolate dehydrogenase
LNDPADSGVRIEADRLEAFMRDVFVALGVPADDASVCAEVLIESDKRGIDSHGVNRCKPIYYDRIRAGILNTVTRFEIVRDRMAVAVVDGHNGMGHVIARRCMEMAISKARRFGIGMVAARNSTHFGIAGYYAQMAVDAGMIGVVGTNARPSTAPTFGVENMLGTNPLTFGIPSDEPHPFMLDCATSVTQRGKIELYERLGLELPEGWVIGSDGRSRVDAAGVLKDFSLGEAALVPLGGIGEETAGYKGYGYAMVVEILSSALQAGNFMKALLGTMDGRSVPIELGHFFIAIDVESFRPLADFKRTVGDIIRDLHSSRKAPGAGQIFVPGEKEHLAWQERRRLGIPVGEGVRADMTAMRDELGLASWKFPWDGA